MTDSTGHASVVRSVETGDLSVPKCHIWLSSGQPPVQLLHHLSKPSRSHSAGVCATLTSQGKGLPYSQGISVIIMFILIINDDDDDDDDDGVSRRDDV